MLLSVWPVLVKRFRNGAKKAINNTKFIGVCFCCIFVIGCMARFGFIFFNYIPTSDPAVFYDTAMEIVETGNMYGNTYVGRYPYTGAYDMLLSLVLYVLPGHAGIITLNAMCDAITVLFLAVLIWVVTHKMGYVFLAASIWWISPFNVVFCALSLPVIVVNMFIMLILLLFVFALNNISSPLRAVGFGLAIGLIMGIANSFRPLMAVFAVAFIVFSIVKYFTANQDRRKKLLSSILATIAMLLMLNCVNFAYEKIIYNKTGLEPNTSGAGWTIFVGSNYESWGCWNETDSQYYAALCEQYDGDYSSVSMRLQYEGIDRWKSLDSIEVVELILRKSVKLVGDQQNMIYNLKMSYPFFGEHERAMNIMHIVCAFWWFVILGLSTVFAYIRVKRRNRYNTQWNYLNLFEISLIGMFFAYLLVEVANRYFTVFFPMMVFEVIIGTYYCLNSPFFESETQDLCVTNT